MDPKIRFDNLTVVFQKGDLENFLVPQIALAIGVLTSSLGVGGIILYLLFCFSV